jgi:predicted ATP-binding protein involved in virulence
MRIRRLELKDFRGFEDESLDLDRPLTVLFGTNGSGKSSVLMACALVLSKCVGGQLFDTWWFDASDTDVRVGATHLRVEGSLLHSGKQSQRTVAHHTGEQGRRQVLEPFASSSPLVALFYAADRQVDAEKDAFSQAKDAGDPLKPISALQDCLAAGHLKFHSFFQWFKAREDVENELKVAQSNLALEDPQLAAVRRAIAGMLPGYTGLRIQRDPLHMVISKGTLRLAVDQLSDGEKLLLVLTADIARRLAMAYSDTPDPLQGEGVVLIDEIELHLHPAWQRRVLGALTTTFPNCQFIVTTHSPQVLSEVPNDAVVLVEDFKFLRPGGPTAGRDSNAILTESMGTPERPEKQNAQVNEISELLDEGSYSEARVKLDALAVELSERDREIVGLRTMLHFLEGERAAHQEGE